MEKQKEITDLICQLVKFESTESQPEKKTEVINFIEKYFQGLRVQIKRFDLDSPAVIITTKETKSPITFYNGHVDVVEGKAELFQPKLEGDLLYGRGVCDNKGQVAMMMVLLKDLIAKEAEINIGLMITADEEIGGSAVSDLINKEGYRADLAIVPDAGEDFAIVHANKGVLHLKITASGKAAHGAMLWQGENALEKLVYGFVKLQSDHFPVVQAEKSWTRSLNLGRIEGGDSVNKVPDKGAIYLDIRYTEADDRQEIMEKVKESFPGCQVEIISSGNYVHTDPGHASITLLQKIAEEVLARPVQLIKEHGATDARFFAEKGIPILSINPRIGGFHTDEEWIDTKTLTDLYQILFLFSLEFSR